MVEMKGLQTPVQMLLEYGRDEGLVNSCTNAAGVW